MLLNQNLYIHDTSWICFYRLWASGEKFPQMLSIIMKKSVQCSTLDWLKVLFSRMMSILKDRPIRNHNLTPSKSHPRIVVLPWILWKEPPPAPEYNPAQRDVFYRYIQPWNRCNFFPSFCCQTIQLKISNTYKVYSLMMLILMTVY